MNKPDIYEDGSYLSNNPTWHEEDSPWKAEQVIKILRKNKIEPLTICEIGCGAGEILNCMTNEFKNDVMFSGYDISPQAFEICKKKEKHNLHFYHKDLLEETGSVFDVAMAIDVFEHVEDYWGFLRKLKTKGEYKVFHIPLDLSIFTVTLGFPILRGRTAVGHIHYFTKETALATLRDTGYEIIDYGYTGGSLELPNRNWKANILKLPRRILYAIHQDLAQRLLGGWALLVLAK